MEKSNEFNELQTAQEYFRKTGIRYGVSGGRVVYGVRAESKAGIKNLSNVLDELIYLGADLGIDSDENCSIIFSLCGYNAKEQTRLRKHFMDEYEVEVF